MSSIPRQDALFGDGDGDGPPSDFVAWRDSQLDSLRSYVRENCIVAADKFRPTITPPATPNWLGLLFAEANRQGIIERVGVTSSTTRSRHGGWIGVWVSGDPA
jgi:hypothetical protein